MNRLGANTSAHPLVPRIEGRIQVIRGLRVMKPAAKATAKAKSPIFEAVYETASDLHALGFIDQRKMRKFDVLCQEPIVDYDSKKIRALRDRFKLSQAVLASVLNTSLSTIRQWEIGDKHPSGPSQKLLNLLERKGLEALI
jgi:putative transcriptional regulator